MARILGILISVVLLGLGLLFLAAAAKAQTGPRIAVGLVSLGMGAGVVWLVVIKRPEVVKKVEITQKIDLTGDIDFETLKCQSCGASLARDSIEVRAGAIFVKCPYCHSDYQVTEAPKW